MALRVVAQINLIHLCRELSNGRDETCPNCPIDENKPVIVFSINKGDYEKKVSKILEIKSLKRKIIAIVTEDDQTVKSMAAYVIEIPKTLECLSPL